MKTKLLLIASMLLCAFVPAHALVYDIFEYEASGSLAIITGLTAEGAGSTTITIPGQIPNSGGLDFYRTIIGEQAFKNNTKLQKVTIGWGCKELRASAFEGCSSLTELHIPSSMMFSSAYDWMGANCLRDCTSLRLLSVNTTVAPNITAATVEGVPSSCVVYVPVWGSAFYPGYEDFIANTVWKRFDVRDGGSYDYRDTATGLCFDIMNYVDKTAHVVKSPTPLSGDVTIPSSVEVNGMTFTVTAIARRAFENSTALTGVTMPHTITDMWGGYGEGAMSKAHAEDDGAQFRGCTALTKVYMSVNLNAIPTRCFYGCTKLFNLAVNYGPKYIGPDAFNGMPITSFSLPSSLEEFRGWEIRGMSKLGELRLNLTYDKMKMASDYISALSALNSLVVPVGNVSQYKNDPYFGRVGNIRAGAIDIGNPSQGYTVTKAPTGTGKANCGEAMRVYAGWRNDNTTTFKLGEYISGNGDRYFRVTAIGDSAFAGASKLASVTFDPDWDGTITRIPDHAFEGCTALKSFPFDDGHLRPLGTIGKRAFAGSGLTGTVNLYNDTYARALGEQAFYDCSSMDELFVFGSTLGDDAFGGSMKSGFRCYVIYPYVSSRRNDAASWTNGKSWAPSRIMPFLVSGTPTMVMAMPSLMANARHCVLPTSSETGGEVKFYAVTGFNRTFAGEFKTTPIAAGTPIKAGDGVLVTGLTPGRLYRMGVPSTTPAAISDNLLVGNPYALPTPVSRITDKYYYYRYRTANEDFYRYYDDFTVPFGSAYLRDPAMSTQSTIVEVDALCYPLMVASTRVKPSNAANITSSYIKSGSASYDPETNTLVFSDLKIETGASTGGMVSQIKGLTLRLDGSNSITTTGENNYYSGAMFEECADVTIVGGSATITLGDNNVLTLHAPSLTLSGGKNGDCMFLMTHEPVDSVMFTIKNCTVDASPFSDDYEENLTVDNATLRGRQLSVGRTLVLKDCYIAKPQNAYFEYGSLWTADGFYSGDYEILPGSAPSSLRGDVNGDGLVNGADVTALYGHLLDGVETAGDGDVNGDGVISGADVTALYDLLLE